MKKSTHNKIICDFSTFAERYVIGRKLWPHQRELIAAIMSGKRVEVARYGRANSRLHMVNNRFVLSKSYPVRRSQKRVFLDEYNGLAVVANEASASFRRLAKLMSKDEAK
jgi:hypothetical protein